jgi:hypothetical protein
MHQATGRDLNQVIGKKYNAAVGGDMSERIQGLRESVSQVSQRLVAPKNHLGSDNINIFQVVVDLLNVVQEMNMQLAMHVHPGPNMPPTNAAAFLTNSLKVGGLSENLKSITL